MPDELIMAAAILLTAVFLRFFYPYQKNRKTGKQRLIEKAKAENACTEGEYEDSQLYLGAEDADSPRMKHDTMRVRYRYTVEGKTYHKTLSFQSPGKNYVDYPGRIAVYYDPQNPKKSACPEEAARAHQRESGCLITLAAAFLFLFVSFRILRFLSGLFFS